MSDIKKASLADLRAMKARGAISGPQAKATPKDVPDDFWETAKVVLPEPKKAVSMRVDPDVLDYFRQQGPGHLTRMHAVLRSYVDAQKNRAG